MTRKICVILFLTIFATSTFAEEWKNTEAKLKKALKKKDFESLEELVSEIVEFNNPNAVLALQLIIQYTQEELESLNKERWKCIRLLTSDVGNTNQTKLSAVGLKIEELQNVEKEVKKKLKEISDKKAIQWIIDNYLDAKIIALKEIAYEFLSQLKTDEFDDKILLKAKSESDPQAKIAAIKCISARKIQATDFLFSCLKENFWRVRYSACEALGIIRTKDSIPQLLTILKNEECYKVRESAGNSLFLITGRRLGNNYNKWLDWWLQNKDTFTLPKEEYIKKLVEAMKNEKASSHTNASFFGIEIKSHRVCFVLDVSGSMAEPHEYKPEGGSGGAITGDSDEKEIPDKPIKGTKLDIAKYELKKAIKKLDKKIKFNIIFYRDNMKKWKEELIEATDENKKSAYAFIDSQTAGGGTNIFDTMEVAMSIGWTYSKKTEKTADPVDTIFLLSDGLPTRGTYMSSSVVRNKITEMNKDKKIIINTIAIGKDAGQSFMKKLAKENGGVYVKR